MRRIVSICLLSAAALMVAAPGAAAAERKASAKTPEITRVSPMRISIGGVLTIRGKNFKSKRARNTVIFKAPNGRSAFAKPRRASTTKLVLIVPEAVSRLLRVSGSRQRPTRLKLRVLAGKFSRFTPRRLSPVVTGVGADGPGGSARVCQADADHDDDLLANDLELRVGTDPCLEDTDGDTMTDGWEYWSAKDLNIKAVPYPARRPFPNALDPSDGAAGPFSRWDFDGDGLTTKEEYRAWRHTGSPFDMGRLNLPGSTPPDLESVLGYSDGTKYSRASEVPPVPAWRSASIPEYGLPNPTQPFPATYDFHVDAPWRDDERDADQDGLSNFIEAARGPGHNAWWKGYFAQDGVSVEPWKEKDYCGQRPGYFDERPFAEVDLADPDIDGDSLLDGEDDQDNDDHINIVEMFEALYDLDGNGAGGVNPAWCGWIDGIIPSIDRTGADWAVNPYNPCAPDPGSRTCPPVPF